MSRTVLIGFVLVLALSAGSALADMSTQERLQRWFQEHDRDHSGYLTSDEVIAYELKQFKRMDRAGDGRLSVDEYCSGIDETAAGEVDRCHRRFATIDKKGDGYITQEELSDFYRRVMQAADKKGDGRITLDEWLAAAGG